MTKPPSSALVESGPRDSREETLQSQGRRSAGAERLKRSFDFVTTAGLLILLIPLLLTTALLILVMQGRPILISHKRVGREGKLFRCLKFRTMVVNADDVLHQHLAADPEARSEWEATRKLKRDPRVTPLGQMLRKSSVDELPQMLNVLRGEMSLVGPRPIVQDEIKFYGADIMHYYRVRPGLTGSWQIGGRSDTSYVQRVRLDSDYVDRWSFGLDLVILAKTVPAVVRSKGSY